MKRAAAALTWDGARYPARRLSAKARAFLGEVTAAKRMASFLSTKEGPVELRICWVPRLKGGPEVIASPFATADGKRVGFRMVRTIAFGPVLGAVYRRLD